MSIRWSVQEVPWPQDVCAAADALAGAGELAWLDSATADHTQEGAPPPCSLIAAGPLAVLEQREGRPATLTVVGRVVAEDRSGWRLWRRVQGRLPGGPALRWGVGPGWVGYVGYEMGRLLERLPANAPEPLGLPWLRMGLYEAVVVLDHGARRAYVVAADGLREALGIERGDGPHGPVRLSQTADSLVQGWPRAAELVNHSPPRSGRTPAIEFELTESEYVDRVRRALEYIGAGDIYQVNFAQPLGIIGAGDPLAHYANLRRANPARYAALLRWDDCAIASASPELFLRVRGREVLTRPIKGTRPRSGDPAVDASYRDELLASAKDRAELAMIVDLHRNDLGHVCAYGSVQVPRPRVLETHPTVYHTVADVTGRLSDGRDALDLLAACFPAGSITGVPKIRAMEIICELEPSGRGAYTGAIGHLSLDGSMTMNVAIRTLQFRGARGTLHVGGGIVADSDPHEEHEETLAKGRGLLAGLGIAAARGATLRA